jgi:hypothetical protein
MRQHPAAERVDPPPLLGKERPLGIAEHLGRI